MKTAAKASLVVALVFIVGVLSGIGAVTCFQTLRSHDPDRDMLIAPRRFAGYETGPVERIAMLAREQFEPILRESMEKIRMLRQKHRPEVRAILVEIRNALRSILDERQCKRFDELSKRKRPASAFPGCGRCIDDEIE